MRRVMVAQSCAALVLAVSFLAGCSGPNKLSNLNGCTVGAAAGGALGVIGGAFAAQGSRSTLIKYGAPVGLGAAGALLGSAIGCALNDTDKKRAAESVSVTTMTGKPQTWSGSEPGVSGDTRVVSRQGNCRTVEQNVTLNDGTQKTEQVQACKTANGWEVSS